MKNSDKNNLNLDTLSKSELHTDKNKNIQNELNTELSDKNDNDDSFYEEDDDIKERLRRRITAKQQEILDALDKLEDSYKEKAKEQKDQNDEPDHEFNYQLGYTKKKKKKKHFFKILLDKTKEIFVVKSKWEGIISALKKLFISTDDKMMLINELSTHNTQIKLLISKIKSEKLLKQIIASALFQKMRNIVDFSALKEFISIQKSFISELKEKYIFEKYLNSSVTQSIIESKIKIFGNIPINDQSISKNAKQDDIIFKNLVQIPIQNEPGVTSSTPIISKASMQIVDISTRMHYQASVPSNNNPINTSLFDFANASITMIKFGINSAVQQIRELFSTTTITQQPMIFSYNPKQNLLTHKHNNGQPHKHNNGQPHQSSHQTPACSCHQMSATTFSINYTSTNFVSNSTISSAQITSIIQQNINR